MFMVWRDVEVIAIRFFPASLSDHCTFEQRLMYYHVFVMPQLWI
jgi:hypothetical protein